MKTAELWETAKSKLRGHFGYYGVTDNFSGIKRFSYEVSQLLYKWLNRRGKRGRINWEKYSVMLKRFPLPQPRIMVNMFKPLRTTIWGAVCVNSASTVLRGAWYQLVQYSGRATSSAKAGGNANTIYSINTGRNRSTRQNKEEFGLKPEKVIHLSGYVCSWCNCLISLLLCGSSTAVFRMIGCHFSMRAGICSLICCRYHPDSTRLR